MNLTCAITVLKSHSAGNSFEAVAVDNHYQLQNDLNEVLCGLRGGIYAFKTAENARVWLCSNLSRFKNADATSENHIVLLNKIYSETNADYLMREIETIAEYQADEWQILECSNEVVQVVNFPIGYLLIDTLDVNPFTFLGYGTWVKFGSGRVLVGQDDTQSEFNGLGETGGAKTHTLTTAQMPVHGHVQNAHNHTQNAHNHTQDAHGHVQRGKGSAGTGTAGNPLTTAGTNDNVTGSTTTAAATATNQAATAINQAATATNQNTGGGEPHNNLQPYITVIFWRRAA